MMLDEPLSDQEVDELDAFLESAATPDECMDITALDGFLTPVAIGPGFPLSSTWMPVRVRAQHEIKRLHTKRIW